MDEAEKRLRDLAREARDGNRQAIDRLIGHYQTRVMKTAEEIDCPFFCSPT